MSEEKLDEILNHNYDGIQEFDNPMPGWWVGMFWATVVFSAAYFVWYHVPVEGRSIHDNYLNEKTAAAKALSKEFDPSMQRPLDASEQDLMKWTKTENVLLYGRAVFGTNCVSCHGSDGSGMVGPNLTDDKWKNVKVVTDVPKVIMKGANGNAMPARGGGTEVSDLDVSAVAAYVISLRENPKPGKSPIPGEVEIPAWPAVKAKAETSPAK